jgi:hypothetical protein
MMPYGFPTIFGRVSNPIPGAIPALFALDRATAVPPACDHIPSNTRCVAEDLWREYCYAGQIAKSDKPDSQQKAFGRAAESLLDMGRVGKWGDLVWITR